MRKGRERSSLNIVTSTIFLYTGHLFYFFIFIDHNSSCFQYHLFYVLVSMKSSRPEVFFGKVFLGISQNSQENTEACNFIKKRLWHRCFSVNFSKSLRTPFLTEHFRWLVLEYQKLENDYALNSCLLYHILKQRGMM